MKRGWDSGCTILLGAVVADVIVLIVFFYYAR